MTDIAFSTSMRTYLALWQTVPGDLLTSAGRPAVRPGGMVAAAVFPRLTSSAAVLQAMSLRRPVRTVIPTGVPAMRAGAGVESMEVRRIKRN